MTDLRAPYAGSTRRELRGTALARRVAGLVDQRVVMAHRGEVRLSDDELSLEGWRTVHPAEVASVQQAYLPEYGRLQAGGSRGGFPSFGFFHRYGAPLVVELTDGDSLVLLIDFSFVSGTTDNAAWLSAVEKFAGGSDA